MGEGAQRAYVENAWGVSCVHWCEKVRLWKMTNTNVWNDQSGGLFTQKCCEVQSSDVFYKLWCLDPLKLKAFLAETHTATSVPRYGVLGGVAWDTSYQLAEFRSKHNQKSAQKHTHAMPVTFKHTFVLCCWLNTEGDENPAFSKLSKQVLLFWTFPQKLFLAGLTHQVYEGCWSTQLVSYILTLHFLNVPGVLFGQPYLNYPNN